MYYLVYHGNRLLGRFDTMEDAYEALPKTTKPYGIHAYYNGDVTVFCGDAYTLACCGWYGDFIESVPRG